MGLVFLAVAAVHVLLLVFFAVRMDTDLSAPEPQPVVVKLTDLREDIPPPPAPPVDTPPPENAVESIAETMIETDEVPENQVLVDPGTLRESTAWVPGQTGGGEEDFLPMHMVSAVPVFPEREILSALVYPPIALRAGIEAIVYLELFVDHEGKIRNIVVLKEDPEGRGFGEAAVRAFAGIRCKPAEANGVPVAVRYRYPVRFKIK
ncbi:MAG: energy transducer TonB [Treponema sp.]|jgi:protein TonB|nr:energy transducer TonB [Treponema sp.]